MRPAPTAGFGRIVPGCTGFSGKTRNVTSFSAKLCNLICETVHQDIC